jgi:hypothetical protein
MGVSGCRTLLRRQGKAHAVRIPAVAVIERYRGSELSEPSARTQSSVGPERAPSEMGVAEGRGRAWRGTGVGLGAGGDLDSAHRPAAAAAVLDVGEEHMSDEPTSA